MKNKQKVIIFYRDGCRHCSSMSAYLGQFKQLEIESLNIDRDKRQSEKYNVVNVPTVIFLDEEGVEMDRTVGSNSMIFGALKRFIDKL